MFKKQWEVSMVHDRKQWKRRLEREGEVGQRKFL